MAKMDEEEIRKAIRRAELEHTLKGECLSTISDRITRWLELDFPKIIPDTHFVFVSAECKTLYRDGYFFACIALCQAVAEALVRFMCERNEFGASISEHFKKNVKELSKRKKKPDCSKLLNEIWEDRPAYHHLNPEVPTNRKKLQATARSKIIALLNVESEVFASELVDGVPKPKYPKYWPETQNGFRNVFLQFEP